MTSIVYVDRKDKFINQLIETAFPGYTGRKVTIHITDSITFHSTMWDEGNRRSYVIVHLSTMKTYGIETAPFMRRSSLHENTFTLESGFVVVVHSQGRVDSIEIHAMANDVTPMLPKPVELTEDEKTVLVATRSLKSSYAGIKDYRFNEANRARGITRERWDVAKNSCISKGYLNKAGAITIDGKNIAGLGRL